MSAAPEGLAVAFSTRSGRVVGWDEQVGAGSVRADDSGETWRFHATSIGDQTRTIANGTWVSFTVRPGPGGLEAFDLFRRS